MNICGVPIHNFEGYVCVEMTSATPFGLNFEYLSYYQTHLKTMGYNSVLFIQRPTGEVYIHLQAFFLLLISKVTLQTCWDSAKRSLLNFFEELYKMYLKSLESQNSLGRPVHIEDYIDYLDLRQTASVIQPHGIQPDSGSHPSHVQKTVTNMYEPGLLEKSVPNSFPPTIPKNVPNTMPEPYRPTPSQNTVQEIGSSNWTPPVSTQNTVNKMHEGNPYQCSQCSMSFKQSANLKSHMMSHNDERNHACPICHREFKRLGDMREHVSTHSGEKPFACSTCGKRFVSRKRMTQHVKTHSDLKPFTCDKCGKKMKTCHSLTLHTRHVHLKEKHFQCQVCQVRFSRKSVLQRHMISHTDERTHACDECGKKFKTIQTLKEHILSHSTEPLKECTECGRKCKTERSLANHMKLHSGVTPHECQICNKKFARIKDMKSHVKYHLRERPFQCSVCGKKFLKEQFLERHKRKHTKKKPYQCSECDIGFDYRISLQHHMIKTHNGPLLPRRGQSAEESDEDSWEKSSSQGDQSSQEHDMELNGSPEGSPVQTTKDASDNETD